MIDPFPAPPKLLAQAVRPLASLLGLSTLPPHIHEVVLSFLFYHVLDTYLAPLCSRRLFGRTYTSLATRTKINWDIRVVSLVQATLISMLTLYVIWKDHERSEMNQRERMVGYTGAAGMVQALVAGYFVWDLMISVKYFQLFGVESLLHAISALFITFLGFVSGVSNEFTLWLDWYFSQRPFANYYGLNFILYEISTPFLNIHWFFDKCSMTGTRYQLYNGIALLTTFFCSRLVWGLYQSVRIYVDLWSVIWATELQRDDLHGSQSAAGVDVVPRWLALTYMGSNTLLSVLNVYWFGKMVQAMMKRFSTEKKATKQNWPLANTYL